MKICVQIILLLALSRLNHYKAEKIEIRFHCGNAEEVFLVWGINNWQCPKNLVLPPGSYYKDNLFYSKMKQNKNGNFAVQLDLKNGTMLDYVFWIRKGPLGKLCDTWDINPDGEDYHSLVKAGAISQIESKEKIVPKESLGVLDLIYPILFISILILCAFGFYFHWKKRGHLFIGRGMKIISASMVLIALLLLVRLTITGKSWEFYFHPFQNFPVMLWSGFYDVSCVLIVASVFLLLNFLSRHRAGLQRIFFAIFNATAVLILIAGAMNIKVVELIGKPFTYQWLYYSNFLKSQDAMSAISVNVSSDHIFRLLALLSAFLIITQITAIALHCTLKNKRTKIYAASLSTSLLLVYLFIAPAKISDIDKAKLQNPLGEFIASINPLASNPELFTMQVPDSLKMKNIPEKQSENNRGNFSKIKNVLVYVFESSPAQYFSVYGSGIDVTPHLAANSEHSIIFENFYAHAPATNLSMVSMLTSMYPMLSYKSITAEHPGIKIPDLSQILNSKGYRTSFFNSADNRFQRANDFLSCRKFNCISDCRDKSCSGQSFVVNSKEWGFMDGRDDQCTAEQLCNWIEMDKNKAFFSLMWTYQTHYPYFFRGKQEKFSNDSIFNRYLNALKYGDLSLGKIIAFLKEKDLFESTLIVVLGDHGEAFGQHGQTTHASRIYEENIHIPLIFINPALKKQRIRVTGGLVDLAPTIASILGEKIPDQWQGENLFSKKENSRTYFFSPWSDFLFGYREGNHKFIYNASINQAEWYDLEKDPFEKTNLISRNDKRQNAALLKLAAWTQYVNMNFEKLLGKK